MRLIDADAICKVCIDEFLAATCDHCVIKEYKLNKSIDAVPVVRCKDCKHSELYFFADNGTTRIEQYKCVHHRMGVNVLEPDDFCSCGERRSHQNILCDQTEGGRP